MSPDSMRSIEQAAEARAQHLLDQAREALQVAEAALAEVAKSPVFGNGIAKGLNDQYETVVQANQSCQNLKVLIAKRFRGEDS